MIQAGTQKTTLHCQNCHHIWAENTLTHVLISIWVAHVKSLRCPECGSKTLDWVRNEERLRERLNAESVAE